MTFELTNTERRYLGLNIVEKHWDKVQLTNEIYLYFDDNTIVKEIIHTEHMYKEVEYSEETDNRQTLLPKTKRGKPKKLNFSSFSTRNGIGTYFEFHVEKSLIIGNCTTQKTFYSTSFEGITINSFDDLKTWLTHWITESSEADIESINAFAKEKRQNIKYKAGDFFCFKINRRNYGFGRLLLDIHKLKKEKAFDNETNHGLTRLMTRPLVVKVYHIISDTKNVDVEALKKCNSFPSQYIMDNKLFYGDFEIIGSLDLEDGELDFPISYASTKEKDTNAELAYVQYGLIYKEKRDAPFDKSFNVEYCDFLELSDYDTRMKRYRKESIGFGLDLNIEIMNNCIKSNSNAFFWETMGSTDLRNPKNLSDKVAIFNHFNIDVNLSYAENFNRLKNTKPMSTIA